MTKLKTRAGHIVYKTTASEIIRLGGFGICDHCGERSLDGYLIPVLNHWICPKCFQEWELTAKYYANDAHIEQRNARYYESMIPIEDSETK